MRQIRPLFCAALAGVLLALCSSAIAAAATEDASQPQIFKWVDEHGIAHYTTDKKRIPRDIRRRVQSLGDTPAVAAAPSPQPVEELVGPLPEAPDHPESWVSRNASPRLSGEALEAREEAERSEALLALDEEIAGVEGEIALREERLIALLDTSTGDTLSEDPALRELARELPTLQADLEVLRERRVELSAP